MGVSLKELLNGGVRARLTESVATPHRLGLVAAGALNFRFNGGIGPTDYGQIAGDRWKEFLRQNPFIIPDISIRHGFIGSSTGQRFEVGITGEEFMKIPIIKWSGYYSRVGATLQSLAVASQQIERPIIALNLPGYGHSSPLTTDQIKAFRENPSEGFRSVARAQLDAMTRHGIHSGILTGESMGCMFALASGIESTQFENFHTEAVVAVSPRTTKTTLPSVVRGLLKSQRENYYNSGEPEKSTLGRIASSVRGSWNTATILAHDRYLLYGAMLTCGDFPILVEEFHRNNPSVPLMILYGELDELNDPDMNKELFSDTGPIGSLTRDGNVHIFPYPGEGHAMMVHPFRFGIEIRNVLDRVLT